MNPTNVTLDKEDIKSNALPQIFDYLSKMDITDERMEEFKINAKKDLSDAKVLELVDLLMKLRKARPPKETYYEEVNMQNKNHHHESEKIN